LPEQVFAPGVHVPVQAPPTHAEAEHATSLPQVPLAVHVSTLLPLHCVWLGAHWPVQPPLMHV
jgi:hypothetical protein